MVIHCPSHSNTYSQERCLQPFRRAFILDDSYQDGENLSYLILISLDNLSSVTADRGGYNLSTYALAIHVHIYNSLSNMGCLHILPHIENLQNNGWCPHMQWTIENIWAFPKHPIHWEPGTWTRYVYLGTWTGGISTNLNMPDLASAYFQRPHSTLRCTMLPPLVDIMALFRSPWSMSWFLNAHCVPVTQRVCHFGFAIAAFAVALVVQWPLWHSVLNAWKSL
jgi:hypothetical protein